MRVVRVLPVATSDRASPRGADVCPQLSPWLSRCFTGRRLTSCRYGAKVGMAGLVARGLCRSFGGVVVLDRVDLEVSRGELVALVGPSGAGKTTMLRCVVGSDRPDAGEVLLDGRVLDEREARARRAVAGVPDDMDFFPDMSVQEHLDMLGRAHGESDPGTMIDEVLAVLALDAGLVPLGVYGPRWIAERADLRPRTRQLNEGLFRLHVEPVLGRLALAAISPERVRTWREGLLEAGVGEVTVAKCYRFLKTILGTAVEDRLLRLNPCRIRGAATERSAERMPLTTEQVLILADAVPARFRVMVLLGTFCSPRFGELGALTRADVDLVRGFIHVRHTLVETGGPPRMGLRSPRRAVDSSQSRLPCCRSWPGTYAATSTQAQPPTSSWGRRASCWGAGTSITSGSGRESPPACPRSTSTISGIPVTP